MDQNKTDATTGAAEHPAGTMRMSLRSKVGARALALAGMTYGIAAAIAMGIASDPDTTIRPL
jgi:hypothetical protein